MGHLKRNSAGHLIRYSSGHLIGNCNCCGDDPCPDCCNCWYRARWYGGECNPDVNPLDGCPECPDGDYCVVPAPGLDILFQFNCEDTSTGEAIYGEGIDIAAILFQYSGGVYTVTLTMGNGCYDGEAGAYQATFEGTCPPSTMELIAIEPDTLRCTGTVTVEFEKLYCSDCCPCEGYCYYIEVFGGDAAENCDNCATEEAGTLTMVCSDTNHPTDPPEAPWGMAGFGWHDGSIPFGNYLDDYIPPGSMVFSWASPILGDCYDGGSDMQWFAVIDTVGVTPCPADGEYTLYPEPAGPGTPPPDVYCEETNTKTARITRVNCCDTCEDMPYYLSCDIVFTQHSDGAGGITNCDGTGGTEDCNTTATLTDEQLTQTGTGECTWNSDNTFPCYFPYFSGAVVQLRCYGGRWELLFGDLTGTYPELITYILGLSPVGIYPDITLCFNDGYIAYDLSITNIVVTA